MTGRPPVLYTNSSASLTRTISNLRLEDPPTPAAEISNPDETTGDRDDARALLIQVRDWLSEEKFKRVTRRQPDPDQTPRLDGDHRGTGLVQRESDQDLALERLETILSNFGAGSSVQMDLKPKKRHSLLNMKRNSIARAFKRAPASSDTEWIGEDVNVPHVEASLDNSRTLAFGGNAATADDIEPAQQKDQKHWDQFKQDIVRLTHTLKVRGWRRIPIEKGSIISVERLSGALTNAVYVVKPPKDLPEPDRSDGSKPFVSKSRPTELLLRVYGPQVEHLIDRDIELNVLRRLARKKIGPRLLGYFTNGRFEEFLHAKTLTAPDLRVPDTSKQIAKRMRELHDGIDLLPSEREGGPQAFVTWDRWVDRCEKVMTWLDLQVKREAEGHKPPSKRYTRRGFVCGVEWPIFKQAYDRYRRELIKECGGEKVIQKRLIFAHNDTQYGNLMRLDPPGDSPLLQPANQHRQLVVIDFEYAGANTPGYEFANQFSEWCYNYHTEASYAFHANWYPTSEEQHRFVRSYVMHRPQFSASASATPKMEAREKTNISDFMLDARSQLGQPAMDYAEEEKAREEKMGADIRALLRETRLWRIANAAHWVAWGIVQANIPELDDPPKKSKTEKIMQAFDRVRDHVHPQSDPLDDDVKDLQEASKHDRPESRTQEESHAEGINDEEESEEFDYLAYAQERAMLFWGDCLQMGIVKEQDLPESLMKQVKIINI